MPKPGDPVKWWQYPPLIIMGVWKAIYAGMTGKPWGGNENR